MRKSVSNWIRISESLIFRLQTADFVVGVVSFEHLEQAFEDSNALLPDSLRHSRHGIPLRDQASAESRRIRDSRSDLPVGAPPHRIPRPE